jgi:hypothetical protein
LRVLFADIGIIVAGLGYSLGALCLFQLANQLRIKLHLFLLGRLVIGRQQDFQQPPHRGFDIATPLHHILDFFQTAQGAAAPESFGQLVEVYPYIAVARFPQSPQNDSGPFYVARIVAPLHQLSDAHQSIFQLPIASGYQRLLNGQLFFWGSRGLARRWGLRGGLRHRHQHHTKPCQGQC